MNQDTLQKVLDLRFLHLNKEKFQLAYVSWRFWSPSTPKSAAEFFITSGFLTTGHVLWSRYHICEDISLNPVAEPVLCGYCSGSGSRLNETDKNMAACSIFRSLFEAPLVFFAALNTLFHSPFVVLFV